MNGRTLKKNIFELLTRHDAEKSRDEICRFPLKQAVNPLFSFFCNTDEMIRWRAVIAMGAAVSLLAEQDMESARVVMRRLIWSLNDESGGIGWGSPEAMGEIMARNKRLAEEYHRILISYIREDGNFIEHEVLQQGVLWGLGRLAYSRPEFVKDAAGFLIPYMRSEEPILRGLAAWTAAAIDSDVTKPFLENLSSDTALIRIFLNETLTECCVGELAGKTFSRSETPESS
ncbi:MAG: hypothetical protein BWK80_11535 [Desulfobacteraceae bacterium IS3]|nr:MAG: hypothetical protein BWK80_11535 [Desulfobacteraceae bacterium IS3]